MPRIIMMDMQPEEEDVIDFIKRGANGFIAKDAALEETRHDHPPGREGRRCGPAGADGDAALAHREASIGAAQTPR